ncbi:hypothetical protein OHB54_02320 [Streptomyces sp. NBC_01007]|nr:hypothetical protein OHB54_02320 [Streptomyces sp. NBC_01007]
MLQRSLTAGRWVPRIDIGVDIGISIGIGAARRLCPLPGDGAPRHGDRPVTDGPPLSG